jgi:hypothetical protein
LAKPSSSIGLFAGLDDIEMNGGSLFKIEHAKNLLLGLGLIRQSQWRAVPSLEPPLSSSDHPGSGPIEKATIWLGHGLYT